MKKTINKENALSEYINTFVQRIPRYAVKYPEGYYCTKQKTLKNMPIIAHLTGIYYVSVLGKYYPFYCVFDFDNVKRIEVDRIRDKFGFDWTNSMLFSSESPNSYHLIFKPIYNGKPLTIRLLQDIFSFIKIFEVFPQINNMFKLPFSPYEISLDFEYKNLKNWEELFHWFIRLDFYDLKNLKNFNISRQSIIFDLEKPIQEIGTLQTSKELFKEGLIIPNSRYDAQFKIISSLCRKNISPEIANEMCRDWLRSKHNGFSEKVNQGNWRAIELEISRQTKSIYNYYEKNSFYPDEVHNSYNGWITKANHIEISEISDNWSEIKTFRKIFKYCNARQGRIFIQIHSDKFIEWSSKENYLKLINKLIQHKKIKRFNFYKVGEFSKSIKWLNKSDINEAILIDSRSPDTIEEEIKKAFKFEEYRELLRKSGFKKNNRNKIIKKIF